MWVKGTAVRSVVIAIERVAGATGVERVMAALPTEVRAAMEPSVLATKQYPVEVSAALHLAISRELGGSGFLMNHRVGIAAAQVDYGTVYRAILRTLVDIDTVLEKVRLNWRQYNSQGEVTWRDRTDGYVRGEVRGVIGYNEPMWWSIAGRVEELLRMCGARSASVKLTRVGPDLCDFEAKWMVGSPSSTSQDER